MDSLKEQPIKYEIKTYGCKVNTYDTGLLQKRFEKSGFTLNNEAPNVFVINTCAVTAEATKEALREIRKIKAKNPEAKVVVTGCAAQVDSEQFAELESADLVVANSHKGQLEELIRDHLGGKLTQKLFKSNIFRKDELEAGGGVEEDHTRSFLKIQDGCNSFCTYCVIPFARGKSRSLAIPDLVQRVNDLYAGGSREAVLTGVHIGDYEDIDTMGNKKSLEDLVESLLDFTRMPRFRLSSLEPVEVTPRLLEFYKNERMCPHFHMSIQSANTKVLAAMKRKYTAQDVEQSLIQIAEAVPNVFVGMDVIVGFPGETEEEFQDTYERLKNLPWSRIHVFPYSPRPGTKANQIEGQHDRMTIMRRADQLRSLSFARHSEMLEKQIGTRKKALMLSKTSGSPTRQRVLTRDYWHVDLPLDEVRSSQEELEVLITGVFRKGPKIDGHLIGQITS